MSVHSANGVLLNKGSVKRQDKFDFKSVIPPPKSWSKEEQKKPDSGDAIPNLKIKA